MVYLVHDKRKQPLCPKQTAIAQLLGEGWTNKEIAKKLEINLYNIVYHVDVLIAKLGARNRTHAAVLFDRGVRTP